MRLEGKVSYVGEIKPKSKGFGQAFKVDGFDGYLSVWGMTEGRVREKVNFVAGDDVIVDYTVTDAGYYNVDRCVRAVAGNFDQFLKKETGLEVIEKKLDIVIQLLRDKNVPTSTAE